MKLRLQLITGIFFFCVFVLRSQDNFQITYSANGNEVIEWLVQSTDGGLLLGGNSNPLNTNSDGILIKTDLNGNILWSKIFGGAGEDEVVTVISCLDGGCAVIGYENSYGNGDYDGWISRFNTNGDVVWSDFFGTPTWDNTTSIIQTKNGGFMAVGHNNYFSSAFMLSLNSEGEMLWKKEYMAGELCWFTNVYETEEGGFYFTGALDHSGFGMSDAFILETDAAGNLIRSKYYGGSDNDNFRSLIPYQDGFLAVGDSWSWQGCQLGWIVKINLNLTVEKAIVFGDINANQRLESVSLISNSMFMALKHTGGNAYVVELDSLLTLKESWQFNPGDAAYSSHMINLQDNTVIFSGSITNNQTLQKDIYLTKFHPEDLTYDCNTVPHSTSLLNIDVPSSSLDLYEVDNNAVFQHLDIENSDFSLQTQKLCIPPPLADFLYADEACVNVPISIINESQDGDSYKWYFEGGTPATSDSINPGSIIYENPGYYSIKLVVNNEGGADSIVKYITIYQGFGFSLGPDTTILLSSSLQFVAFGEYDSLLWSTGDTTSYLVVQATDLELGDNQIWLDIYDWPCINSDTININVVDNSSINENIYPDILLYPNPVGKYSQIALKSADIPTSVVFYNQIGAEVLKLHPIDNLLDVRCLEPGVYIVELTFREYILKRRLIII